MIFKLLQFRNKLIDASKIYIIDQKISNSKAFYIEFFFRNEFRFILVEYY